MGCFPCFPFREPIWFEYYGPIRQAETANAINALIADHINRANGRARIPMRKVTPPHLKIGAALNKNPVSAITDDSITISFSATTDGTITLQTETVTETYEFQPGIDLEQKFTRPTETQWLIKFDFHMENGVSCRMITLNAHIANDPIITDEKIVVNGIIQTISKVYRQENDENESSDNGFNDGLCLICCTEVSTVIAFPCRHCCMCRECAERFSTVSCHCPVCRAIVTELIDCSPEQST